MTVMDTVRVALRGTGSTVAQAPGMNSLANEIISRGGLTSSPDPDVTIAAEPPHLRPVFCHERAGMGPLPPVRLPV